MLNQIILVGRINNIDENKKVITLSVNSNVKNEDGIYPINYIDITLTGNVFENTINYCSINDIVGIKGHFERQDIKEEIKIFAERVTFLSSKKINEE